MVGPVNAVMEHPVDGRGRGDARKKVVINSPPEMQAKVSKRIDINCPWTDMSYWKVTRKPLLLYYSSASIGRPRASFNNHSAVANNMDHPANVAQITGGLVFTLDDRMRCRPQPTVSGPNWRTQYAPGYRPEKVPDDGKWHKISVKLKLQDGCRFLSVHAKPGYYACRG